MEARERVQQFLCTTLAPNRLWTFLHVELCWLDHERVDIVQGSSTDNDHAEGIGVGPQALEKAIPARTVRKRRENFDKVPQVEGLRPTFDLDFDNVLDAFEIQAQ